MVRCASKNGHQKGTCTNFVNYYRFKIQTDINGVWGSGVRGLYD